MVTNDRRLGRNGGPVTELDGKLVRFAQISGESYGEGVLALEITTLTDTAYEERLLSPEPLVSGTGNGWNGEWMHHYDPHKLEDGSWLIATDGGGTDHFRPITLLRRHLARFRKGSR